jgi:hypothetical protein
MGMRQMTFDIPDEVAEQFSSKLTDDVEAQLWIGPSAL